MRKDDIKVFLMYVLQIKLFIVNNKYIKNLWLRIFISFLFLYVIQFLCVYLRGREYNNN